MFTVSVLLLLASKTFAYSVSFQDKSQHQSLQDCLLARDVPTSLHNSSDWAQLTTAYNLRLQYTPAAVTIPTTPQHVASSVTCATITGLKVQARSGGHSYGSYSLGGKNGSLTVDLQRFNEITLDKTTGIAKVGGGVRLGNLGVEIFKQGHAALPHGTFPGVGIGGHYTHGGFGYSSRRWGLALDTIVAMDVVLADGTFVHATSTNHSDIFYVLRGAADSFGIITNFYLQTHPAPSQIVSFSATFSSALNSSRTAASIVLKLQDFALSSPYMDRNITLEIYMNVFGQFFVRGWYFGAQEHFSNTVFPAMLDGIPKPDNSTIESRSWLDALADIAEGEPLIEPLTGYDNHQTFYSKSVVTREAEPLTRRALESFFEYVITRGLKVDFPWNTFISLYGGRDSRINVPSADDSAYSHRDSLWVFQNVGSSPNSLPPFASEITTFVNGLNTAVTEAQPDGEFLAYPNYLDPELTPKEAIRLYYGAATYRKLAGIKKIVDPKKVFWNPQAIGNVNLDD